MVLAPPLDAADRLSTAEVVAIAILTQPPSLAECLAGLSARGVGTVVLAVCGPRVGTKKLGAIAAFMSDLRTAHREPPPRSNAAGKKTKKKTGKKMKPEEGRRALE